MHVDILGASGLLGKYLVREWDQDEVHGFSSKDLDIRQRQQVGEMLERHRPDWVILAAAYTDVDGCERNPELARATNTAGALNVAEATRDVGARLLFLSSDYVFDGAKRSPYEVTDARNPQSVYGHSKADAEAAILEVIPNTCIVRTAWVFGTHGRCFPDTILKLSEARDSIDVVDDQRGAPTYARHLAGAIIQLCRKNAEGIVHVTNTGDCTWFEFASALIQLSSLPTKIRPTTTEKFPRPAKRPAYSVLSLASLGHYAIRMPNWEEGLREYLVERGTGR